MAMQQRETVTFRDATIIFKNLSGEAKKFNAEGVRNFAVLIDEQQSRELEQQGWNVKPLKRREEDDEQLYFLKVSVSYKIRPPRVWLISSAGRSLLGEGLVGMLDQLETNKIDLVISAYDWRLDTGASGRKAYLQSMFATMYEDELELEYADVPQLGAAAGDGPTMAIESRPYADYEGEVVD